MRYEVSFYNFIRHFFIQFFDEKQSILGIMLQNNKTTELSMLVILALYAVNDC